MIQSKFSITDEHIEFLSRHKHFGFQNKSQMVRAALDRLQSELLRQWVAESAEVYAEIYSNDDETKEWTEAALSDWPE